MSTEDKIDRDEAEQQRFLEELQEMFENGELDFEFAASDATSQLYAEVDLLMSCIPWVGSYGISDESRLGDFCMGEDDIKDVSDNLTLMFEWNEVEWMFDLGFAELVLQIKQRLPNWPEPVISH